MKKTFKLIITLMALTLVVGSLLTSVSAANAGDVFTLEGIGTDALQHWSFYYTTAAADVADPTDSMIALTKVSRQGSQIGNGTWPFNVDFKTKAYDDPAWELGVPGVPIAPNKNIMDETYALVFFTTDAKYLFVYPMNKTVNETETYYRPIVAFTAPESGKYTISFDGSVSWSPDEMTMDAYVNGNKVAGSSYVFSATQSEGQIGVEGSTKAYSLEVTLKKNEQLCLVFEYSVSENRGTLENLKATLTEIVDDSAVTPPVTPSNPVTADATLGLSVLCAAAVAVAAVIIKKRR